jgi:hypothetical protein
MDKLAPVVKMVRLVLQTGYIEEYGVISPKSLILFANAESGKTLAIDQFKGLENIYYTNDISPKVFVDEIFRRIERGEITHIVIPDLINCIEKNKSTRQRTINLFKTIIEEGLESLDTFHMRYKSEKPIKAGLISAITAQSFMTMRREWVRSGFISRCIPFSYSYSQYSVHQIIQSIISQEAITDFEKKIKTTPADIEIDAHLANQFIGAAQTTARQVEAYGFRLLKIFISLAKANAMLEDRAAVTQEDINEVMRLSQWINYNFNQI